MPSRSLIVSLEGRGTVKLGESTHVATGGEGSVHRVGDTVVKVYTDVGKMVRDGMADKIDLLRHIVHPTIVGPQGLARDQSGALVGYYMPWVEGEPLARLFVTTFRTRAGFGDREDLALVEGMRETVACAHANNATMVDANELNWLVRMQPGLPPAPRVIDVDSWAIGRWPASVVMPSVRDWSATRFDDATDWFAWAVVTWQVWTGIHPYQGRAPGYKPGELERRMRDNVSVLSPDVRLPASVRDPSRIPANLLSWYRAVFLDGQRVEPPVKFAGVPVAAAARVLRVVTTGSGKLSFIKLATCPADIVRIWASGAALDVHGQVTDLSTGRVVATGVESSGEVVRTPDGWLVATRERDPTFTFHDGRNTHALTCGLAMRRVFRSHDRLYAVTDTEMVDLVVQILKRPLLATGKRWSALPDATKWFDNVAIVDLMGGMLLVLPLADGGIAQVRCRDLDGLTPVAARASERFAAVVAVDKTGGHKWLEFSFDKAYGTYAASLHDTDMSDVNVAILPNGVVAKVVHDGELVVFVPANGNATMVTDRSVSTSDLLASWCQKVVVARGREVWQVSLS